MLRLIAVIFIVLPALSFVTSQATVYADSTESIYVPASTPIMSEVNGTSVPRPMEPWVDHWWDITFWTDTSGGHMPPYMTGQFTAVSNTIGNLVSGDAVLYLPLNVAYGTSSTNCVWFQFDVQLDPGGAVQWFIWDIQGPGTSSGDFHYTPIGIAYTPGHEYDFSLTTSGTNSVTFSIVDTTSSTSWSCSSWAWTVPSLNMLYDLSMFSPSSAVEGYTTSSQLTNVPYFPTKVGSGISYFWHSPGMAPSGIYTDVNVDSSSDYYWYMYGSRADLSVVKVVDLADAIPEDTLTYTVTVENIGTGTATAIELTDTFPDGTVETRMLVDLGPGDSTTETFSYVVPFPTADLTVLTNTATVNGEDLQGMPEEDPSNNVATASTVVHTPILDLSKTATPSVNAGEAITYTITYENTGSGDAEGVVIIDTLPKDVYYSLALDQGAGPAPDLVTINVDGTTTLTWLVASLPSSSGVMTIEYTARPSLLLFAGESVSNDATLDFTDANGNDYPELTASATTDITSVPPGQNPRSLGFFRNHNAFWSDEILARIQATDDRFDGADGTLPDGQLSASEVEAVLAHGGNQPKVLMMQLLTTYFNLATRQINADTLIDSSMANWLGLANVRDAVEYATNTLNLPVNKFTRARYSNITRVLDEINNNISEIY